MSQQSVLARMFGVRRRRRAHAARSVSDFVIRSTDACGVREAGPRPSRDPAEIEAREALQGQRARELEAENLRLQSMAGDLMLQTAILRATMRRRVRDDSLAAG